MCVKCFSWLGHIFEEMTALFPHTAGAVAGVKLIHWPFLRYRLTLLCMVRNWLFHFGTSFREVGWTARSHWHWKFLTYFHPVEFKLCVIVTCDALRKTFDAFSAYAKTLIEMVFLACCLNLSESFEILYYANFLWPVHVGIRFYVLVLFWSHWRDWMWVDCLTFLSSEGIFHFKFKVCIIVNIWTCSCA